LKIHIAILGSAILLTGCQRIDQRIVLIDGSCEHARAMGDLAHYSTPLRAKNSSLGFIRIRSDANWNAENSTNVLGTVPSGTLLWAEGPLKDWDTPSGIGYAVAIRDKEGHTGRGYVSFQVVDQLPKK
jgi:hypothetical protein